jgi:hypothetical protein
VKLRLRPPAADLQKGMAVPFGERLLLLVLLGGVALHHWQGWLAWLPWAPESLQAGPLLPRFGVGLIALLLPVLVAGWWPKPLLYGLLPLVWALILSRYLPLGMVEAGQLLPVSAFPWQGAAAALWPSWSADQHVVAFCQSAVIAVGLIWSLVILRRLLLTSPRLLGLGSTLAIALALGGRWLTGMA